MELAAGIVIGILISLVLVVVLGVRFFWDNLKEWYRDFKSNL